MSHLRARSTEAKPQKIPLMFTPPRGKASQLDSLNLRLVIIAGSSSARKWYNRRATLVLSIALGTLFTLLVSHFFSGPSPVTAVEHSSTAQAQLLYLQSRGQPEPQDTAGITDKDTGSSSQWFQWGLFWGGKQKSAPVSDEEAARVGAEKPHTLVLYIFSNTDKEYINNLRFFIRNGIREGDGCDYVIVNNVGEGSPVRNPRLHCSDTVSALKSDALLIQLDKEMDLPELPSNARYARHDNTCYDWGTFGWALQTQDIDTDNYEYFIFLNSSVRGPFLPPYIPANMHFSQLMTAKLSDTVKLVGPIISCEGPRTLPTGEQRDNPHIQSFAVATDQAGLKVLVADGKVFECHDALDEAMYYSDVGSSLAILDAGYTLHSFMSQYEGVDWRDQDNWGCNQKQNPFTLDAVDDVALHPMALMFVKVKHWGVQLSYPSMRSAVQYDQWMVPDVDGNVVLDNYEGLSAGRVLATAARGPDCWDCAFYLEYNKDLNFSCFDAFSHFTNSGQFELRPRRWLCNSPWSEHGVPFNPPNTGERWPLIGPNICQRPDATFKLPSQSSAGLLQSLRDTPHPHSRPTELL